MRCAMPGFGEVLAVDAQHVAPGCSQIFLNCIFARDNHHITTGENFVNPTTNIARLVEVNQIHRRSCFSFHFFGIR